MTDFELQQVEELKTLISYDKYEVIDPWNIGKYTGSKCFYLTGAVNPVLHPDSKFDDPRLWGSERYEDEHFDYLLVERRFVTPPREAEIEHEHSRVTYRHYVPVRR